MRRGWILILSLTALILGGGTAWWWSTPAQLWWLRYKVQHRVIPMKDDIPWGGDRLAMIDILEPQWSRLIDRGYVSWYCRRFTTEWTGDQRQRVYGRMGRELRFPTPYEAVGGVGTVHAERGRYTTLQYLIPPDQHAIFDAILRDVIGSTGEVTDPPLRPSFWFRADNPSTP